MLVFQNKLVFLGNQAQLFNEHLPYDLYIINLKLLIAFVHDLFLLEEVFEIATVQYLVGQGFDALQCMEPLLLILDHQVQEVLVDVDQEIRLLQTFVDDFLNNSLVQHSY